MAYCSSTDVQALNPKRTYSATTTPTSTHLTALIDQIAAEIDAVLAARGLESPATSPAGWVSFLKAVNAYGAAALAEMAMFPETTEKGATPHAAKMEEKYQDWLDKIEAGTITPSTLSGDLVASDYTESDDQDDYPDPVFRKSSDNLEF